MKVRWGVLAIYSTALIGTSALAGVTVTVQDSKNQKERPTVLFFDGNKMRIETSERKDSAVIYDGDSQKMFVIEPDQKQYAEITPQAVKAQMNEASKKVQENMAKMTPEQRKQMDEALAKMDPESRKRVEAMMSGKGGSPPEPTKADAKKDNIKWEQTASQQTVAGYRCRGFKEIRNGKPQSQGCFIAWDAGAVTKADLAPMVKMQEFWSQVGWGPGSSGKFGWTQLQEMPGFPGIWSNLSDNGEVDSEHTVTSVKRGGVSNDKFQPPAGFKKVDMNQLGH
jgi:hypothetical protein